ncbi:hypothetical protein COLO4_05054 [Corchorus olitorius]|uniref:Protein kinase domain-containing protein n=1 Tax=Corchorus olitorius TaxID=93759 RepID=A0A1R3KS40_9ROSI|nr:hypothetical protein COLO4_05054 [Corchorus olitorius]
MEKVKASLKIPSSLDWSDPDPCKWTKVGCLDNRVTRIQIGKLNVGGTLPPELRNLSELSTFEVMNNQITGPLPSLAGLSKLQEANLHNNNFSSFPSDFFSGLTSLVHVFLDYNPFEPWEIPESVTDAKTLQTFSATGANIKGRIPGFFNFDTFSQLRVLHLAMNNLEGELPNGLAGTSIESFWVNGQRLNGTIDVIQNMSSLTEVWLHGNQFSGPLPDFSMLTGLQNLSLRDNQFTGVVPASLINLKSLFVVNLTNNELQGPTPKFADNVIVDMRAGSNRFCLDDPGVACDDRVNILLSILEPVGYPQTFADNWKGNDPCNNWLGVACAQGNIVSILFAKKGLTGTISSNFAKLTSLTTLDLSGNNLTGTIPVELTTLPKLTKLDVSNNRLYGKLPPFRQNVVLVTEGNPDIGKDKAPTPDGKSPGGSSSGGSSSGSKKSNTGTVVGSVIGGVGGLSLLALGIFLYARKGKRTSRVQSPTTVVIHPHHSGDQEGVKITVAGSSVNGGSETFSHTSSGPSDMHMVEAGNMLLLMANIQLKQDWQEHLGIWRQITGRVTTKVDVFSFGVILMEMITGRKALDETQPEESLHLVTWFRRMHLNKETFRKAIDETIQPDEETLASISTVSELAGHCCAREPYQRPDMSHVVNVLSSLAELWKPAELDTDDEFAIDYDMSLPQVLKKWQAFENSDESSSFLASTDTTQTSIPCRPSGFADSFASADAR